MHCYKHRSSIQKVCHTLGNLNHKVKQVYILRNKVKKISKDIENIQLKKKQVSVVVDAHTKHLESIMEKHPEWSKEYTIAPIYEEESTEPTYITNSKIASIMNTYYELACKENQLDELQQTLQEYKMEYNYAIMDIQDHHDWILSTIKDNESEAKFFGIPYNFHRCYQAIQDTIPEQFPTI